MAHIEKFQASAMGNMLGHYERRAELEHGYERENIDSTRTNLNFNLCTRPDPLGFVDERIAALDLKRAPRKDAVRMIDTVVTLPAAYHGDTREFMAAVKETLDGIFGAENCAGAYVHMDEKTPHMHYASVPVTQDGRLSAKSLLNRTFMRRFHDRLEAGVCERLGIERAGLTLTDEEREQRAGKYVDLPEYKAVQDAVRRKEQRSMELNNEIADKEGDLIELDSQLEDVRLDIDAATERLESVQADLRDLESFGQKGVLELGALAAGRGEGGGAGERERAAAERNRELGERVATLKAEKERASGELVELEGRAEELGGARDAAQGRVRDLERRRDGLAGRVERLRGRVSDAWGELVDLARGWFGFVRVPARLEWVCDALSGVLSGFERRGGMWGRNEPLDVSRDAMERGYDLESESRGAWAASEELEREGWHEGPPRSQGFSR